MVHKNQFLKCLFAFILLASQAGCSQTHKATGMTPVVPAETAAASPAPEIDLPVQGVIDEKFASELSPLIAKLQASKAGTSILPGETDPVVYVPANSRLFFFQTILNTETPPAAESGNKFFVLYDYSRGGYLGKEYTVKTVNLPPTPDTQTIMASLKLYSESQGEIHFIQEVSAEGGAGNKSYRELVEKAVPPLDKFPPDRRSRVEQDLEEIIGYACGVEMDPGIDAYRQAHLLSLALTSANWADRKQAVRYLQTVDPLPADIRYSLLPFLTDEEIGHDIAVLFARLGNDPSVLQEIIDFSNSPAEAFRLRAAEILGMIPSRPEAAVEPLLKLVMDKEESVRQAAVTGLSRLHNPAANNRLLGWLKDPDTETRLHAVEALGFIFDLDESTFPLITPLLQDVSPLVRAAAARSLTYKKDPSGATLLAFTNAIKNETDPDAFQAELDAINQLGGGEQTQAAIRAALTSKSAELRSAAAARIQFYRDMPGTAGLLVFALGDDALPVRTEAARSASMLAMRRSSGQTSWSDTEENEIIHALSEVVSKDSQETQGDAARALGYFESSAREAVPVLIEALKQDTGYNGYDLTKALQEITSVDIGEDPAAWENWWAGEQGQ